MQQIYAPAMAGLQSLIDAIERKKSVKTVVLTSSMSAMAPRPEPALKSESHWSDAEEQKARGNWYGAAKTSQELLAAERLPALGVRYVAICPTMVLGPMLHKGESAASTMGRLAAWMKGQGPAGGGGEASGGAAECRQQ